ncbi:hypothetical protein [Bacillus massiliigorillae]|uniref:hypothetical protein n=1 Tax=Bacillus massiliigorillae TaxID=1243664 RepID=UPI00039FCF46|nr:hypothetical protein [Bacillus massiliigorillae]
MKKGLTYAALSALAVTAVAAAPAPQASAAEATQAPNGFYDIVTKKYTTVAEFAALTNKGQFLTNTNLYVVVGGEVISAVDLITKSDAQLEASKQTVAQFEAAKNVDLKKIAEGISGLQVESVSAINAKQVEIKFGKAVDKTTVISSGNLVNITFTKIGSANVITSGDATAELSKDGKTLTITAKAGESFSGSYAVTGTDSIADESGKKLTPYSEVKTFKDVSRPTFEGVTYSTDGTDRFAELKFNEPVNVTDLAISASRVDGVALNGSTDVTTTFSATGNVVKVKLTVASADQGKDIKLTLTNLKDFAGNLSSPNPVTATVKYGVEDVTGPVVSNVSVKDNKTLIVKFNEALSATPASTAFGYAASPTDVPSSSVTKIDEQTYEVGFAAALPKGLQTLNIPAVKDIHNNLSTSTTKLVSFTLDEAAPTVQSTKVEKIDGKEYLVITYDENVSPVASKSVDLEYAVDYVSKTKSISTVVASGSTQNFTLYKPVNGLSNSVKLDLSSLTDSVVYTAKLQAGIVEDLNGNDSKEKTGVTFTRSSNVDAGNPTATLSAVTNDSLTVTFDKKVNPTTALNKDNYSIEGISIKNIKLTANSASSAAVVLEFEKGSSTFNGERTVNIAGVKSEAGDLMNPFNGVKEFKENIAPVVKKAELTATNKVKLTFSEEVKETAVGNNFEVFIGDSTTAVASSDADITAGVTVVDITLTTPLTQADLDKGVVVKPKSTIDVVDNAGNALDLKSINVSIAQ